MESDKLLLIGIDGATWDRIDPLIEQGKLENLRSLRDGGASGPLESTVIPNTPPAWISFLTGKNPGKTGIYDFIGRKEGTYDLKVCTSLDNEEPTIFSILSKAGRRVYSVNMPMTYPPEKINGVLISGIPLPPGARDHCHPPEILSELEKEVGPYLVDIDYVKYGAQREGGASELDGYEALLAELYGALELRQKAALHLLNKGQPGGPPDLFSVVYSIVDRVQHYFWKFIDPDHSGYSEEGAERFGDTIDRAYEAVDRSIGELLAALPDHQVVVMSDHGFGPYYKDFHLNRWLIDKGYLVLKKVPRWDWRQTNAGHMLGRVGMGGLAGSLPKAISECSILRPYRKRTVDREDIVWSKTKAYAGILGICVNLAGREPEGIVKSGIEYDELTSRIMKDLEELRDEKTGRKLIDISDVKENRFHGPKTFMAADVYFIVAGLSYNTTTRLDVDHLFDDRTQFGMSGTHRMDGVFIVRSSGVKPGTRLESASIMDISPTILYIMGHPVLRGMDGKVLEEIFETKVFGERPVRFLDEDLLRTAREESGYTEEEEEEIRDLLKGLGYLS